MAASGTTSCTTVLTALSVAERSRSIRTSMKQEASTSMSTKLPPIDPGNIRVLVRVEGAGKTMFVDFATSELPRWLSELDDGAKALSRNPPIKGTDEGAVTARQIF